MTSKGLLNQLLQNTFISSIIIAIIHSLLPRAVGTMVHFNYFLYIYPERLHSAGAYIANKLCLTPTIINLTWTVGLLFLLRAGASLP